MERLQCRWKNIIYAEGLGKVGIGENIWVKKLWWKIIVIGKWVEKNRIQGRGVILNEPILPFKCIVIFKKL